MKKEYKHKTPEAAERERRHQFGQPEANPRHIIEGAKAVSQREFYKWVESKATEEELKAYVADLSNPYVRRKFVASFQKADEPHDFFELTNQTHGQPKQTVEVQELPEIHCEVFGEN